ncbi:response regulator receiver protein [Microbulbifer epialgicus]|uniref:Response regulator receiver protein n=1 Tax=Microbulbifer epialgicus TaxID=393907 RepID=A0ABV4P7I2_9GAMM
MFRFKALVISALISLPVTAQEDSFSSIIKRVYPQSNGTLVLTFHDDPQSCTSPSTPNYYYVKVGENGVTQEGLNLMFSTALAAGAAQQKVSVYFDTSTNSCFINRLSVNY